MGRKIPAKKHRGVKDPAKQHAQRMLSLKSKINAPPKDPDEQPVPRSLTQLFSFKDRLENKTLSKKKKKKVNVFHNTEEISNKRNPVSKMRKVPGESSREFSLRINSAIRCLNTDQHDHEYPEDIEEDDRKAERLAFQRDRKEKKRRKAAKNNTEEKDETPKLSRTQKLTLKKKAKKLKIAEKHNQSEVMYDRVGFGEVAHAPPTFTAKPRKAEVQDGAPRPGRRDLLLNKFLPSDVTTSIKVKQKDLPTAERLRRERARLDAVAAYRAIKLNKTSKT